MVFLFVGSSALTEASFPRGLAIPQLLLSSACAIVLAMKASPRAVFPHRGLAPHQFTPMSGAHKITGANAGGRRQLPMRTRWAARVAQFCRSAFGPVRRRRACCHRFMLAEIGHARGYQRPASLRLSV